MANSQNNLYGFPQPLSKSFPPPLVAQRAPTTSDIAYPPGQLWVDEADVAYYGLISVVSGSANWLLFGTDDGPLNTLEGDSGGALAPSAGNIVLAGTANQITSSGSGSTITFSLIGPYTPATYTSHGVLVGAGTSSIVALAVGATNSVLQGTTGSNPAFTTTPTVVTLATTGAITAGTGLTATTGNIAASSGNVSASGSVTGGIGVTATVGPLTATNGNLVLGHAGNKLVIHASTAANDSLGTATLASGVVVVSTTAVTASSLIYLSYNTCASSLACSLSYGTIIAGTSFKITSQDLTDSTSTVNYWIVN